MKYDGRLYTQAEVDAMNNTPKTVESLINEAETKWASQGRTDEQKWAVRNFITGSMQEAITALNELRKADMAYAIGEFDRTRTRTGNDYADSIHEAEVNAVNKYIVKARLRAEERLQK
jgi:hypothetical protein